MQSPAGGRRSPRAARRIQIRRRRAAALVVGFTVIVAAVVVASTIPTHPPVALPQQDSAGMFAAGAQPAEQLVVAQLSGTDLLLPVRQDAATAVVFVPTIAVVKRSPGRGNNSCVDAYSFPTSV